LARSWLPRRCSAPGATPRPWPRISWLIAERGIGLVTGEVGAGKTVDARAATAALDCSRFSVVYLSDPTLGVRGLNAEIVRALGAVLRFLRAGLIPQAQELAPDNRAQGPSAPRV